MPKTLNTEKIVQEIGRRKTPIAARRSTIPLMHRAPKNHARKRGRKPLEIDPERIKIMAAQGYTVREIAATIPCDPQTIYNRFSVEIEQGRARGDGLIRRIIFEEAVIKRNITALMKLADWRLGMNKPETTDQYDRGAMIAALSERAEVVCKQKPGTRRHPRILAYYCARADVADEIRQRFRLRV